MKTFALIFDIDVAKKIGIDEAVVYQWLLSQVTLSTAKGDAYVTDGKTWVLCSKQLLTFVFPCWTENQVGRILSNIVKKEYAEIKDSEQSGYSWYAPIEQDGVPTSKAKKKEKKEEPANDTGREYMFTHPDGSKEVVRTTTGKLVNEMLDMFKYVNPSYDDFFSRKVHRNALVKMLDRYSTPQLLALLSILPTTNAMQYAPIITTPLEFERLAPKLIAFCKKHQNEGNKQMPKISL